MASIVYSSIRSSFLHLMRLLAKSCESNSDPVEGGINGRAVALMSLECILAHRRFIGESPLAEFEFMKAFGCAERECAVKKVCDCDTDEEAPSGSVAGCVSENDAALDTTEGCWTFPSTELPCNGWKEICDEDEWVSNGFTGAVGALSDVELRFPPPLDDTNAVKGLFDR